MASKIKIFLILLIINNSFLLNSQQYNDDLGPDFHKKKGELLSEYVFVPGDGDLFVAYVYHISTVLELHEMETRVYQKTSEEKGPGVKFDCEIETIGA